MWSSGSLPAWCRSSGGGLWSWSFAWLGADLVAVGLGYITNASAMFGKLPDGSMRLVRVLAFFPFLVLTWATWQLARLVSREPPVSRISESLLVSRRLLAHELPADVDVVIDLTAEFLEPRGVRRPGRYRFFPILDAGVPPPGKLQSFLAALPSSGTLLIHCAQGHGRTALVTACLLLERGLSTSAEAAVASVLAARPGARMNRAQRAFVETYTRTRPLVPPSPVLASRQGEDL